MQATSRRQSNGRATNDALYYAIGGSLQICFLGQCSRGGRRMLWVLGGLLLLLRQQVAIGSTLKHVIGHTNISVLQSYSVDAQQRRGRQRTATEFPARARRRRLLWHSTRLALRPWRGSQRFNASALQVNVFKCFCFLARSLRITAGLHAVVWELAGHQARHHATRFERSRRRRSHHSDSRAAVAWWV